MKRLAILFLVGVLSSCATVPAENPWQDLTVDEKPAATPIRCGAFPVPSGVTADTIVYDQAGTNDLEAYRVCAKANEALVEAHSQQIGQLKVTRRALVEAGQSQRRIAELRLTMLEDERRHHFWSGLGYWVLIAGAIAL